MNINRIKDLREDRDLTQKEAAEMMGYHTTTYARWEQQTHQIRLCDAIVIAKFYGVSLDYIAGLTNDPKRYYKK